MVQYSKIRRIIALAVLCLLAPQIAVAATRIWRPDLTLGEFEYSNPQRWTPVPQPPGMGDDVRFEAGASLNRTTAFVDSPNLVNNSLIVTKEVGVLLIMSSPYSLTTSVGVGGGTSGQNSRLTLQGNEMLAGTVNVGLAGSSSAMATLEVGRSAAETSKLTAANVYVGGTASGAGMKSLLDVAYGSLRVTNSMTVYDPGEVRVNMDHGTVLIDSASPASAPTLATVVGWSGAGQLTIHGKYDTRKLIVGRNAGASGTVTIVQAPSGDVSLGPIEMANAGTATMNLTSAVIESDELTLGVGGTLNLDKSSLGGSESQSVIRGTISVTGGSSKLDGAIDFQNATVAVGSGSTLTLGGGTDELTKYAGGSFTGAGAIADGGAGPVEFSASTTIGVGTFSVGLSTVTVRRNVTARINSQALSTSGAASFSGTLVLEGGVWEASLQNNRTWQMFGEVQMHRSLGVTPIMRGTSPVEVYGRISSDGEGRIESPVVHLGVIQGPTMGTEFLNLTGMVSGNGDFEGNVSFSGVFSPGASPAQVSFAGALRLQQSASLLMEISGPTPGSNYDQLAVVGAAALDGTLSVSLGGFTPSIGNSFTLIQAGSVNGMFESVTLPSLATDRSWQLTYTANSVMLSVVPVNLPGDFDMDGDVDGADFLEWQRGNSPNVLSPSDLGDWKTSFGQLPVIDLNSRYVPEAASAQTLLIALASLCLADGRRRQG